MRARALIAGCSGHTLTPGERAFFREADPLGFILFGRNIESPGQVRALTADMREAVGRLDALVLVDQEGGRVQRLKPPHWHRYPAGRTYGSLTCDLASARQAAWLGARLIAHDLRQLGITVDCLPVLDVPVAGAHDIIGDRAYANEPDRVADFGRAAAEGLLAGGVLPVIKHIPGHGRAEADSHEALPRVGATLEQLRQRDFRPFRAMVDMPIAMTAHVVFEAIDPAAPATTSRRVVADIIRREIGFPGLLLTDDLSMKALSGSLRARAEAAFRAGCDVALHCNGDLAEMTGVAEAAPTLSHETLGRALSALRLIGRESEPFDTADARLKLDAALAEAA